MDRCCLQSVELVSCAVWNGSELFSKVRLLWETGGLIFKISNGNGYGSTVECPFVNHPDIYTH